MRHHKLNTPEKRARVGERIKVAATQAGMSLKELSEQTGVSPSAIYQYVRGITAIPTTLLERIAAVTRVHSSFFDPAQDARQMLALPADVHLHENSAPTYNAETGTRARIEAEYRQIKALSEAHSAPHQNRAAYLSALEQMLTLARALENREREAALLTQIGQARMQEGDYPGAQSSLLSARDLHTKENAERYNQATLDLAQALIESKAAAEARPYLEEIQAGSAPGERWRIEILLGRICLQTKDNAGALTHYGQAAEAVLALNSPLLEQAALMPLTMAVAQLSFAAGHFSASLSLWNRIALHAEQERNAPLYIEALLSRADCQQAMGSLPEAARALKIASTLAIFLPGAEPFRCRTQSRLVRLLRLLGAQEEAEENARAALRIAHRTGKSEDRFCAELAMAENCLAAGQWNEALDYALAALDTARRYGTSEERAGAHELRARAYVTEYETYREKANQPAAQTALNRALAEARAAVEAAGTAEALQEQIAARLTLAHIYLLQGAGQEAEQEAQAAQEIIESGPRGIKSLLNTGTSSLLSLLSRDLDLPSLFQSNSRLDVPLLEWRLQYLLGTLAAKKQEKKTAYVAFRAATLTLCQIFIGLTLPQARAFQKQNPLIPSLLDGLSECAPTKEAKKEAEALIERIARMTEQEQAAVVIASVPVTAGN